MNHACRAGFRAAALIALALSLQLGACAPDPRDAGAPPADDASGRPGQLDADAGLVSEGALFELTFPLVDADGRTRQIAEFGGAPFVASMIYSSCTSVCPRVVADLHALERALPAHERARTRFVLFSLDPERDTPDALRRFAANHALRPSHWTLLAAGPDDMRTLAAVLGVRFRPDDDGEIAHSAVIAVVDARGVVRYRQTGLQADVTPLVSAVQAAQ